MSERLFPGQEVGSLPRPSWQLLAQRGAPQTEASRAEFARWDGKLGLGAELPEATATVLGGTPGPAVAEAAGELASLFAIRFLESSGLDRVYDGEARRIEMYEHPVRRLRGFRFVGHVRSFDAKYYRKAAVVGPVGLERPYHVEEFEFVRDHAHAAPKLPITGPYTLADWSFNEFYLARQPGWKGREARRTAQRELVVALAREAIRPTLRELVARGCRTVQIDEPAAGTHPDEVALVVEGFNAATEGIDAELSMHVCYTDYPKLLPGLLEAKRCRQWTWEFANRDDESNDAYAALDELRQYGDDRAVGVGVVDVHVDRLESPELVADRLARAARHLGDPARLWANPDCGLRTRSLEVAHAKLGAMVAGARLARERLGGRD